MDQITLQSLVTILRGKGFTGVLAFDEGKVLFMEGSIKLASYKSESGELVMDFISVLPLSPGARVTPLSREQVKLWLKWQELLYENEELFISPLPEVDRRTLEKLLEDNELSYLLVHTPKGD